MIGELMILNYFDNKKEHFKQEGSGGGGAFAFLIFMIQMILIFGTFFYAIYLSFQRNDGFSLIGFLAACYYPIFYIIYAFISPVD
tara:strand:+ start:1951 stop:2205 length:255 start_codon:yes stop_codon:yes gene_type:complete